MVHLSWGLLGATVGTIIKKKKRKGNAEEDEDDHDISTKRIILAFAASAIQGVVLFVVLCPLAILYVFGLGISAGASLWRLIKHDFGNDGGANKKPALQVLYSLAVAQGVLFGYKIIHAFAARRGLVKLVYNHWQLHERVPEKLVAEYLEETVAGCEKDSSFATGRNFVTYAVDLMMEAKSSEVFIAGIKVLGGAIGCAESGRKVLAKYLLTRSDDSSRSIVQRLLETVGPRSPYSREIKEHVVRILDIIGPCIRLVQFPQAIECLCSVVDTSGDSQRWGYNDDDYGHDIWMETYWEWTGYDNRYKDYESSGDLLDDYEKNYIMYGQRIDSPDLGSTLLKKLFQCLQCNRKKVEIEEKENIRSGFDPLLIRAMDIIFKLVAREGNIWIMRTCVSNTLLHKIATLPLKLHKDNNDDPCRLSESQEKKQLQMLQQCWVLTERLLMALQPAATPVGEGRQRRSEENQEIEEVEGEGSTMRLLRRSIESAIKSIFDCRDCSLTQKRRAIHILLHHSLDMSLIKDSESNRRRLSWILLRILCSTVDDSKYWMVPSLTSPNNNRYDFNGIRRLAGEKLSEMLREKHELPPLEGEKLPKMLRENRKLPPQETTTERGLIHLALMDLKSAFDADSEDISIKTYTIIIMDGLLLVNDFRYYEVWEVEKFLHDVLPKVVQETLSVLCDSKTEVTDVEQGRLHKALISFCYNICFSSYVGYYDFKAIASKTCEEQGKSLEDFKGLLSQSVYK